MISQLITSLMHLIITIIEKAGYVGIFALLAAESTMIPITSLVTLPFIGFLVSQGSFNMVLAILVAALGSLTGAIFSFTIGYLGKDTLVRSLIKKYGRFILIRVEDLDKSERWFRKYGEKIIFFARLIPVVKMFISLPAGMARMNPKKFITFTLLGSLTWATLMIYVGTILGNNWSRIYVYYQKFEPFIIILGVLLIVVYILRKVRKSA